MERSLDRLGAAFRAVGLARGKILELADLPPTTDLGLAALSVTPELGAEWLPPPGGPP